MRVYSQDESAPPVVKVLATIPNASEVGPTHGQFTVSRSGGNLATALPVLFAMGGTATNCFDYACIQSITIPADQTSVQVPVTVLQDTLAESTETVFLTLMPDASYVIGTPSAVVTIADGARAGECSAVGERRREPDDHAAGCGEPRRHGERRRQSRIRRTRSR